MAEVVCILGMHRSGTSLAAGILRLMGWHLGPEDKLMGPKRDNPRGFWEYRPFTDLNDEILEAFGGTWDLPPAFPPRWERDRRLDDVRDRARAALEADFGTATRWAWKDPRTSLTLPFWRRLLGPMRYVLCVRSPVDVGESLAARDDMAFEDGVALWRTYVTSALRHTTGGPRSVVFFEDLVEAWPAEVGHLRWFVGERGALTEEVAARIDEFVAGELRHHASGDGVTAEDPRVPPAVRAMYLTLRAASLARRTGDPDAGRLERAADALAGP
ncbi:MAG: sulfotransferase family protein [Actinomycetota bacterium]